jgi:uncharacterized SAM-binding protein YcdF (DUF218 family)
MYLIEKLLTSLVMPCGILWLALVAITIIAWRRRQRFTATALLFLIAGYTVAGNSLVGSWVMARLEQEYTGINAFDEGTFDVVFVLGGGVGSRLGGTPQLHEAGDRVILAARMYHAQLTKKLACTGQRQFIGERGPAELTASLWRELNIPDSSIIQVAGGNTSEEIAAIQRLVTDRTYGTRIGLVTSAWHMRRAMELAGRAGLNIRPLPADFRGGLPSSFILSVVPSAAGFQSNQLAAKEILGTIVGR